MFPSIFQLASGVLATAAAAPGVLAVAGLLLLAGTAIGLHRRFDGLTHHHD